MLLSEEYCCQFLALEGEIGMGNRQDLTKGSILKCLVTIAVPIIGTQLMQMLYNLTDLFWLGRYGGEGSSLGADMVAASGTAGMFLWFANGLMMIGNLGANIGGSHALGRGDQEEARRYSQHALFMAACLGVLTAVLYLLFRQPLIGFFQIQEQHVVDAAVTYLSIVALGIPFTYITSVVSGTFHAAGNSRTPFVINAAGLVGNMVLDPVLILYADMGVAGAAIATIAAQILVALLSLAALCLPRTRPLGSYSLRGFTVDWRKVRQIVRWSLPVCLETMFFSSLSMIISRFISAYSVQAISVFKVGNQIESLSWLMAKAFSSAMTAFVGQNYGAGQAERIARGHRSSTFVMLAWGAIVTLLMVFAGQQIFYFLLPNAAVAPLGADYLKILAICQIPAMLEGVGSGTFQGSGNTLPSSLTSILCNLARVGLAYAMSLTPLGLYGLWLGVTLGAVARGLLTYFWSCLLVRNIQRKAIA